MLLPSIRFVLFWNEVISSKAQQNMRVNGLFWTPIRNIFCKYNLLCKSTSCNLHRMVQTPILISRVQCQLKLVKFHHFLHQIKKKKSIFGQFIKHCKILEFRGSFKWREISFWRNVNFYPFSKGWLSYDKKKCTSSLKFLLLSLLNIAYIFWQITVAEWPSYSTDKSILKKLFFS